MSQQRQFKRLQSVTPLQPEPSQTWSPPYQGSPPIQPPFATNTPLPNVQQTPWPLQSPQTNHCNRCGKELGFIDRIGSHKQPTRCRTCSNQMHQALQRFRMTFLNVTRPGVLSANEWAALQHIAAQEHLDKSEALTFIMNDAIALVERIVAQAEANGGVTNDVEQQVSHMLNVLLVPPEIAFPLLARVTQLKRHANMQKLDHAVAELEAKGDVSEEDERHIHRLQATLAILPEEAQPFYKRIASLKQRATIQRFQRAAALVESKGEITEEAQQSLIQLQQSLAIPNEIAQPIFQRLVVLKKRANIEGFRRAVAFVEENGEVTEETQQYILQLQRSLSIPSEIAAPIFKRLAYLKKLTRIRNGNLPTISTNVHLESDEICHLETSAIYHKVNTKSTTYLVGRLVATNKRLHFLSTERGMTINWNNIMRVEVRSSVPTSNGVYLELSKGTVGVYLELSKGTGNGLYAVSDPTLVSAVLDTLVKIAKRQLVVTNAEPSRHIPQDIKNAVWQRDGGKCTQCGSTSYLEFDHIIPHTKGGANTVANVQLLCRSCNLKKSDRI